MKNTSKYSRQLMLISLGILIGVTGCGKKRPYETVINFEKENKDLISTNEDYIYLIGVTKTDTDAHPEASRPHWKSYPKIVRFSFSKTSLDVYQVNREQATNNNPLTAKPVISIPVRHVDYRCKQNAFKECTGSEEENNDIMWTERKYFEPDWNKVEIIEKSFLPMALDEIGDGCFAKKGQGAVSWKLEKDALNVELEAVYEIKDMSCINFADVDGIEDLLEKMTFRVRHHISLVKLKSLADPNYKEIIYPESEQNHFGFFTTEDSKLDVDNRDTQANEIVKLDRWSPNRKKIVYYLNDEFEKPEHSQIKMLTFKAAEAVNLGFKQAGSDLQFEVRSADKEMSAEDLRNNMVVLVPEPLDSGLLGYGPHISNPLTGEILHATVVMYLGNMKTSVGRTWDQVVKEHIESQKQTPEQEKSEKSQKIADSKAEAKETLRSFTQSISPMMVKDLGQINHIKAKNRLEKSLENNGNYSAFTMNLGLDTEKLVEQAGKSVNFKVKAKQKARIVSVKSGDASGINDISELAKQESLMDYYARNTYYHSDMYNFGGAILAAFEGKIPGNLLKPWDQLTSVEREQVINLVVPHAWAFTLIHEIGHTLGLRHNFEGSEDKKNFYTAEELEKLQGIKYPIHLSSVMEYPFEDVGALPILGKYDVAALAYGYSRKAFAADGSLVDLEEGGIGPTLAKLSEELKKLPEKENTPEKRAKYQLRDFGFCTDEHVSVNPGCKMFDMGSTLTEIAEHLIGMREHFYEYRNKRNGRKNFSHLSDGTYASFTLGNFRQMRMFFERYELLAERLPLVEEWDNPKYIPDAPSRELLQDLRTSTMLIADFYLRVLLTPDQTCLIKPQGQPLEALPLFAFMDRRAAGINRINTDLYQCTDLNFKGANAEFLGEFGKPFANKKAPTNPNPYIDQMDVRGIWPDKLSALYFLLARQIGIESSDRFSANFLHIPELQGPLIVVLKAIILDEVEREYAVGDEKLIAYVPMAFSHILRPSMSGLANRIFGLRKPETRLAEKVLSSIAAHSPTVSDRPIAEAILDNFRIHRKLTEDELKQGGWSVIDTSNHKRYYYREENTLAANIKTRLNIIDNLEAVSGESLTKIYKALTAIAALKTEEEKKAKYEELKKTMTEKNEEKSFEFFFKLPNGIKAINQATTGNLKPRFYYEEVLELMPN